jgi:PAT family beta-lactamase induction signal transducer AmpG
VDLTATPGRRRLLFAVLYFAEGAPIGFLWWALPTILRQHRVELPEITSFVAVLALPWTFKFLLAPLVDVARSAGIPLRWLVVALQLGMMATLLPLAGADSFADLRAWRGALLLHAVTAALQDVAIDALCVGITAPAERGRVNGWMQAGMLAGRGAFGAGGLLLASRWGASAPVLGLLVVLVLASAVVVVGLPSRAGRPPERRSVSELARDLAGVFRRARTWRALLFAGVAGAGFEATGALAGPFLVDHGMSSDTLAWTLELPKVLAMAAGGSSRRRSPP